MAPGINGRHTGTVPKVKAHNDSSRDYVRREQSFNHIPNNLVSLDWQSAPDVRHSRTRKTSNTQSASLDYDDFAPEGITPHDSSRFIPSTAVQGEEQVNWAVARYPQEMNGHSESGSTTSTASKRSRTPRNIMPDRESKSNNINKMPDRNQVVSRLNEIRDYIKQTSSLMNTLKNSGEPRHQEQYQKLSRMIAELRESEERLKKFLPEFNNVQQSKSDNSTVENVEVLTDRAGSSGHSNSANMSSVGGRGTAEGGRSHSEEPCGAVLKSSDSARRNELKMKVEESQRRLQALQEHQAALLTLQQKAQEQLKEARASQGILMARAMGLQNSLPLPPPSTTDDRQSVCSNGTNSQSASTESQQNSQGLQGNMQNLSDRLHSLQELYDNRNELAQMLGERDEELVSEHLVLQDKLRELQYKKQHMDHLVAEFQALNSIPGINSESQTDGGSSKDVSEDGEAEYSEGEPEYQVVRDKIAELNMMKAQLAQLKGIMSEVQNREVLTQNGSDTASGIRENGEEVEHEDQAVNLRRQKKDKSKGKSEKGVVRTNSNASASGSSKPDNIAHAGSESERARDIQFKTMQLQEAKARLSHLQDLLAAVSEFHSRGQPVPDQYLELLSNEAAKDEETIEAQFSHGRSADREKTPVLQQVQQVQECSNEMPENSEVTLEVVQAMTRDLRQQTLTLQEERERLMSARRELGKLQRELPLREKKTNTQVDAQTHQMLLQAELQAKKRELEELMRKDQGQTSAINQDVCSEASADKSETPAYSFLAEGTTNATWGGSTQGTLDDLVEHENDAQEQSAGYSSDDGQEDDDDDHRFRPSSSQQLRHPQLNNNSNNNNNKDSSHSHTTTRELLSMSLDSGRMSLSGNVNTNHSNTTSIAGSSSQAPPPSSGSNRAQRQALASHNVWRKGSADSGTSAPRAVWTPTSQQARQENQCTTEELVSNNNLETNNSSSSATLHNAGVAANPSSNWWQQQALQLQHQLEVTNNLYQSIVLEQQQQQYGNNLLPSLAAGTTVPPFWSFPPPPVLFPPRPSQSNSAQSGGHLLTNDMYYQQLLAASQLNQQQMLVTTVNQCCHLLWLQQREMTALRAAVHAALQEKTACGTGNRRGESFSPPVLVGQPEDAILITSNQNSTQPTPHQSQSNLARLQQTPGNPVLSTFSPHQNLKLSYSGGLFQSPEEASGPSGVTSAHSLPNLSQTTTSANSVFSPAHTDTLPSTSAPLNNNAPSFSAVGAQTSAPSFPTGTLTLTFPMNNNVNFNNRSQQQPMSSLLQPGPGAPWMQQGAPGATPGLLQSHTSPSPVPALNNQVPPGNRANNYWDNFRSYSRQNLLSTSTKSNEGASHNPSPLVDRSHNTLRSSLSQTSSFSASGLQPTTSALSQNVGTMYSGPEQNIPLCNISRKDKLNIEQYQSNQDNMSFPGPSHNNMPDTGGFQYSLIGSQTSATSHTRSRSDFQLQPNLSRSRVVSNGSVPQEPQFQTNLAEGCLTGGVSQHDFINLADFHVDARNLSFTDQSLHNQQNFSATSDSLISYQNNQGVRYEEEAQPLFDLKPQGIKVSGINKRKNPKSSTTQSRQSHQDSNTSTRKHGTGNPLFEALSESVYSEVAALISANENRPHFLIQLFRDLQMISSDPLRQRTLQSIQEVVRRYLASGTADSIEGTESQLPLNGQNENDAVHNEHIPSKSPLPSDDENEKNGDGHYHLAEQLSSTISGQTEEAHCLVDRCEPSSTSHIIVENEEGAAALLPTSLSSPRTLPRNAAWNVKDGLTLPTELSSRTSKLDWEVQAVLVDLLPFLKAHLDDTCSTTLLEAVRRLTLQLVTAQNISAIANPVQHSTQHSRLGCCYPGQLDALLEDALLKFQGCRLRDIGEELLTVVAEVLLSELTFLRLVDTVSRGDNTNENNEECCKNSVVQEEDEEQNEVLSHHPSESSQHFLTPEIGNHAYHDPQEVTLGAEGYNGDLAEADQSHHEEAVGGLPELEAESAAAAAVSVKEEEEDPVKMQSNQAEGSSVVAEACAMENGLDTAENDLIQADSVVYERSGDFNKTEAEEEWEVEQDREQGLDRVPTRLSTEQQRPGACSGRSTPERDIHNLVSHSGNQTDTSAP